MLLLPSQGSALSTGAENQATLGSVQANLNHLFNTRRGSLVHKPDYGIPDLTTVYQGFPESIFQFVNTIWEVIEKYEPRLYDVRISYNREPKTDCVLQLTIEAKLHKRQIIFDTYFFSGGSAKALAQPVYA